ncbi:hypothetical protein ACFQY0_00285 [Haloferula chungangensis]|uniref:SGNH/GDSL hydrolase family protein n=1 Tax=Haloferula chungangensis TaxID=1048331 RepID=A0ABW2KZS4_9BACT
MKLSSKSFRTHAIGLAGTFAVILLLFTLVNTWINPIWVTPAPWTNNDFAKDRQIYRNLRTAKAGLARSGDWDVALLGSSRVAIGLDPSIPQWGENQVVNLGMSGASINENAAMAEYVIEHQPDLKSLILGVDLTDLTSETDLARNAGFYDSPLNKLGDPFERELRYYVGFSTAEASYKTMQARRNGFIPPYTTKGHWAHHRVTETMRNVLQRDSVPFAIRYVRKRQIELALSDTKVASLRRAIRACLENDVELVIFIPPNHAVYLSVFPLCSDPDPFFRLDRQTILELVETEQAKFPDAPKVVVWDFNDFHPLNCEKVPTDSETRAKFWIDGTHSFEALGNVILSRIYGWDLQDPLEASYGEILDLETLSAREARIKEGYENYRNEHPDDWNFLLSVMKEFDPKDED